MTVQLCREYCKEQALEVVIEYSDPKGIWKAFDQMMAVATGRRPPFDNIVVSSYPKLGRHEMEAMDCRQKLRENGVLLRSARETSEAQLD